MARVKSGPFHHSANNSYEAMSASRLAQEVEPRSPAEMVVDAVRQHKRLDSLLDRLRLLTEVRDGAEYCVERMIHAEHDRARITLALLNVGALGSKRVAASSLNQAAEVVGWGSVVQASLAVIYLASCREAAKTCGSEGMALFKRSILAGVGAAALGESLGMESGESFSLGLLHDLGMLGLAVWQGEGYRQMIDSSASPEPEKERSEFGVDHTQAGLALLIYRGFSASLCEASAFHHGDLERISVSARLAACSWRLAGAGREAATCCAGTLGVAEQAAFKASEAIASARAGITSLFG